MQVSFPKLEKLTLEGVDNVKKLWAPKVSSPSNCMPNLNVLKLGSCDDLEYLSLVDVAESLKNLNTLSVEECKSMDRAHG